MNEKKINKKNKDFGIGIELFKSQKDPQSNHLDRIKVKT